MRHLWKGESGKNDGGLIEEGKCNVLFGFALV